MADSVPVAGLHKKSVLAQVDPAEVGAGDQAERAGRDCPDQDGEPRLRYDEADDRAHWDSESQRVLPGVLASPTLVRRGRPAPDRVPHAGRLRREGRVDPELSCRVADHDDVVGQENVVSTLERW